MSDDDLLRRVRLADPLADDGQGPLRADPTAVLASVLAQPRRLSSRRLVRARYRTVLLAAVGAAVLLVPAAVAIHRQLLNPMDQTPTAYAGDLPGTYAATVSGLKPASRNGRWTISFTRPYSQMGNSKGGYTLSHNRKLVARGEYSLQYSSVGAMVHVRDMSGPGHCVEEIVGGNYLVHVKGSKLTFTHFQDKCVKRRVVLSSRTFTRGT